MSQSRCSQAPLHRSIGLIDEALHEHATPPPIAGHANRSRRLIQCAKDFGHYPSGMVKSLVAQVVDLSDEFGLTACRMYAPSADGVCSETAKTGSLFRAQSPRSEFFSKLLEKPPYCRFQTFFSGVTSGALAGSR